MGWNWHRSHKAKQSKTQKFERLAKGWRKSWPVLPLVFFWGRWLWLDSETEVFVPWSPRIQTNVALQVAVNVVNWEWVNHSWSFLVHSSRKLMQHGWNCLNLSNWCGFSMIFPMFYLKLAWVGLPRSCKENKKQVESFMASGLMPSSTKPHLYIFGGHSGKATSGDRLLIQLGTAWPHETI